MPKPTFLIGLLPAECTLTVDEVWPDGDAPEYPTAQDVANAMRGGVDGVMREWNIAPESIEIMSSHGDRAIYR